MKNNQVNSNKTITKKGKKKFSLKSLFRNNKFLLIISLISSIIIWVNMSIDVESGTTRVISDIPIDIPLSTEAKDSGLKVFSGGTQTVSVTVSGDRITLGSVTKDDILVTAQAAAMIDTSGNYDLSLTASKVNSTDSFNIVSDPSLTSTPVFVDYYREKTFNVVDNVVYQVADGYYAASTLSAPKVTVSGPQSEILKIDSVSVSDNLGGPINSAQTVNLPVKVYDDNGYELSTNLINLSVSEVTVTISVLPEKYVTLNPTFINKPTGLSVDNINISIDPNEILIAGPSTEIESVSSIDLDEIDFSELNNSKQTIKANVLMPDNCSNLSNNSTADVTIDFSSMVSKNFTVTDLAVRGLSSEYQSKVTTQSLEVTIIGPEDQIEALSASDIKGVIEVTANSVTTGSTSMPVTINISGATSCWAYGTYEANVTISKG